MSNLGLIIEERSRDIGDFLVGRLLPFRRKRMIGPFIFLDHMGPKTFSPGERMDIRPHPHIGLSTLTYLLEGEVVHRDSLGTVQKITPGAVNWMTAGKGIVHSERSPENGSNLPNRMHGLQIWVALPKDLEEMEPEFHHIEAQKLPQWQEDGAKLKLIAGTAFGRTSPVPVHSDLFLAEVVTGDVVLPMNSSDLSGELGIYVLSGNVTAANETIADGNLMLAKTDESCGFTIEQGSHVFLLGGTPFNEERHIRWNFVSSDKDKIDQAARLWEDRAFPKIPGDEGYVPLPAAMRSLPGG